MKKYLKYASAVTAGIALNTVGGFVARSFNLPIWLDMTGTVVASYFGGLWGGMIAALFNNVMTAFSDPASLIYSVTSIFAALLIHLFIKKGYMNDVMKAIISSFWLGLLYTAVSTPINIIFRGGYSGNYWGDTLVDMLKWYDVSESVAALAGEAIVQVVDKQICIMLAYFIIYIVSRLKKPDKKGMKTAALFLASAIAVSAACPAEVSADEYSIFFNNFVEKTYDNTNGMVSSEANVICETDDGFIWIGSYAGLTRFDGNEFEFVREGGLVNVVSMMTDSMGRLWIGTNDAGIARYEKGRYTYFTADDGLPSNSVRCFAEDEDGCVYVGTADRICRFGADDTIEILEQDITFASEITVYNGIPVVLDNNGGIFALDGDDILTAAEGNENYFYYCLGQTSDGLMVGAESGELFSAEIVSGSIVLEKQTDIGVNRISAIFEDSSGRLWIASASGLGYIGQDGNYRRISFDGLDSSITGFHEDYQGNIWIASSRYGVMKLSESSFINVFEKLGAENQVVNAVVRYKDCFLCGTDNGIVVFGENGLSDEFDQLVEMTDGTRVRSIMTDSKEGLWLCTYNGLIYCSPDGDIKRYTEKTDGVTSDRFRCITELSDGTIAAGTADGINFIKDGAVTGTLTDEDGLANTQILCIIECGGGTVLAGSDGSGIYRITDGKLEDNYTVADGLSSDVVLRLVPCGDKYIAVTSNALCLMSAGGKAEKLESFPYFNNYDVIVRNDTVYVTCSAGMYELSVSELLSDDCGHPVLYGAGEGLFHGLTANSWNYVSEDGLLYLCSNSGVVLFDENSEMPEVNLKFGIVSAECDGTELHRDRDNTFTIPGNAQELSVYASVRNYTFSDVKARFFVKELDDNPRVYDWNAIEPIRIFKPTASEYNICLQILDSSGENVLQEKTYTVGTEAKAWETPLFRIYLIAVCVEISLFALISIISMIIFVIRKNELEQLREELEDKISIQTGKLMTREKEIKELFVQTVTALSEAVDAKDRYTSGHSKRVAEYSRMIAAKMGKTKEEQEEIYRAGLLHDIGKIRIPVEIINKESKLTDEEYNIIKIHPVTGYHILRGISGSKLIAISAKYHHERYDGKGYPNGLEGEKIPESARILGVADAYDAMTSNRSYRKALPQDVVRSEIEKGRGTQFDPNIADIMLQLIDEDKDYTMKQADSLQRRILTVDDEPMNNKIIAHIMSDEPIYEIVSVCSGKEALDILEEQSFNLILLDVMMPDMDGFETLRAIREKYNTPVVLMTSDRDLESTVDFAEIGCDDYVTKPFLPLLIKEVVHDLTERMIVE
ncbi:MAG: HD domain-containing phosphohydrolase [Oscillospiraceae bacterium]